MDGLPGEIAQLMAEGGASRFEINRMLRHLGSIAGEMREELAEIEERKQQLIGDDPLANLIGSNGNDRLLSSEGGDHVPEGTFDGKRSDSGHAEPGEPAAAVAEVASAGKLIIPPIADEAIAAGTPRDLTDAEAMASAASGG